jgi:hypothetical protein
MDTDQDELLLQTLQLLDARLKRLEFLLDGGVQPEDGSEQTVAQRVKKMEEAVGSLASRSKVVNDVLGLRMFILRGTGSSGLTRSRSQTSGYFQRHQQTIETNL